MNVLRLFIALAGMGVALIGARFYVAATRSVSLTDMGAFMSGLQTVVVASGVMAIGAWAALRVVKNRQAI